MSIYSRAECNAYSSSTLITSGSPPNLPAILPPGLTDSKVAEKNGEIFFPKLQDSSVSSPKIMDSDLGRQGFS